MGSAVAGSDGVGSMVVSLSVGAGPVDVIFGTGIPVSGAFSNSEVILEGEVGGN